MKSSAKKVELASVDDLFSGIHEDDEQTEEAENGGGDAEDAAGEADNEHKKP